MNDVLTKNRKSHDLGKASEKAPEARRARFDQLTMTGMEPALSLPKGRRKLERSIWTFYTAIAVRISLTEVEHLGHGKSRDIHKFTGSSTVRRNQVHDPRKNIFDQDFPVLLLSADAVAYLLSFLLTQPVH